MSIKKVGILTSGGDCQGLNAAIRGVCKSLYGIYGEENIEIYGIVDGYRGLINCEYRLLKREEFSGILNLGGTILGTSREPFKKIRDIEKDNISLFCHDSGCEVTFFDDPARVPWQEVKRLTAEQTFRHDVPLNDYAFKCIDHKFLAVFAGRNGKFEAAAVYRQMSTFADIQVEEYQELGDK